MKKKKKKGFCNYRTSNIWLCSILETDSEKYVSWFLEVFVILEIMQHFTRIFKWDIFNLFNEPYLYIMPNETGSKWSCNCE
jgi:hypothetical protein